MVFFEIKILLAFQGLSARGVFEGRRFWERAGRVEPLEGMRVLYGLFGERVDPWKVGKKRGLGRGGRLMVFYKEGREGLG